MVRLRKPSLLWWPYRRRIHSVCSVNKAHPALMAYGRPASLLLVMFPVWVVFGHVFPTPIRFSNSTLGELVLNWKWCCTKRRFANLHGARFWIPVGRMWMGLPSDTGTPLFSTNHRPAGRESTTGTRAATMMPQAPQAPSPDTISGSTCEKVQYLSFLSQNKRHRRYFPESLCW